MKIRSGLGILLVSGALVGCTAAAPSNEGYDFQITEGAEQASVIMTDGHGALLGQVEVRMGDYIDVETKQQLHGRILTVAVGEQEQGNETVGMAPVKLPLFPEQEKAALNAFLLDPHVAPLLAKWNITFDVLQPEPNAGAQNEAAYDACSPNPIGGNCASGSCCQYYNNVVQYQNVCCNNGVDNQVALNRICGFYAGNCAPVGPNGCGVCWHSYYSSCSISQTNCAMTYHACVFTGHCQTTADCCNGVCSAGNCNPR